MSSAEATRSTSADETLRDLYERHGDRVFGFCRNRLRSRQEAEDATQTTFLHAFRALQRGAFPVSEKAWLYKIAENVCFTAHRTNGRRSDREVANGADLVELAPSPERQPEALFGLNEALAGIPDSQRRAFVLRELRGLSHREIAGQIGVSVTAAEMLVFRARRSLARALDSGAALKGRVAGLLDVGAILNLLKTVFGGATAAKVAAAAAVVAVSALPAGDSTTPPQKRGASTIHAEQTGKRPIAIAVAGAETSTAKADQALERSTPRGDRPPPPGEAETKLPQPGPGAPAGETTVSPVAPPAADQPGLPATPALPTPPLAPDVPEVPGVPPPVVPVELPHLPVELPDLPILRQPPLDLELDLELELPGPNELLPPLPQP